jgi:hypothetical protein
MSRWIVALPLIAVGVSLGDGRAAMAVPVADPVAGTATSAQQQHRPSKAARAVRHRHRFAQSSKPAGGGPLAYALAKPVPPFPPPLPGVDDEAVLRPRSVYTISVPAPVATPAERSQAEAASDSNPGRRLDTDEAPGSRPLLADKADKYDSARIPVMVLGTPASPGPLTAIQLLMLFGACGGAAIGFYGLVALGTQRRRRRVGPSPPPRRSQARPPSSHRDRYAERPETQRLFPHQFGAAIRGR